MIEKLLKKFKLSANRINIVQNLYWAVLGKIVQIIASIFVGILVARYLGPEQYGLMNYVISYVTLFSVIATFGLDSIVIRELSKPGSDRDVLLGSAFILRLFFSSITILLILLTLVLFEADRFTSLMIMMYASSLIVNPFGIIRNYFTSIIWNELIVKTEIVRIVIGAAIKLYLLFNNYSLIWFIAAITFEFMLIASGYLMVYRRRIDRFSKWKFNLETIKMYIRESFPLLLSGTAIIIYQKIDQVMIRNMIDEETLGYFAVAARMTELIIFIPTIIAQTITPLLVQTRQRDENEYQSKRLLFIDIMVWSSFILSLVLSLSAKPIITILFGNKYLAAIPVLYVLAWKTVFIGLFESSGQIIIVENKQRFAVFRNLIGCVAAVLFNLLLIPSLGIIGSAIATLITMACTGYIAHLVIKPYRYMFKLQTKAILSGPMRLYRFRLNYGRNDSNI